MFSLFLLIDFGLTNFWHTCGDP